jgi:hypothetical protein
MSRRSNRLPATAAGMARPRGLRVDNRQVSLNSRFSDHVWDFSNENRNPAAGGHDKRIFWSFKMPGGGLFTDAQFRSLLMASKQFIYAVRWHPVDGPALAPATLRTLFRPLEAVHRLPDELFQSDPSVQGRIASTLRGLHSGSSVFRNQQSGKIQKYSADAETPSIQGRNDGWIDD